MCARNSCGVLAAGASVYVRPMSTPAWSSLPPMPIAVARGHVRGGRPVELTRSRAVADLPHAEQLRQATAVAGAQRRGHRVVGVRQRARDLALVHVRRAQLDVAAVRLQPLVVLGRDAVAEHVHRLWLAAEARGQLLRDEHVRAVGDLEHASDRVVVGDRHEVHAAALGQLVDLLRRRRALGQPHRALHAQARLLRGARVAVHVHARRRPPRLRCRSPDVHTSQISLQRGIFCDQAAMMV